MKKLIALFLFFMVNSIVHSQNKKPVIVELFTSQGCSSCPSADLLLSSILKESSSNEVIGLSFHVDYWDYIGWKDPFASPDNTRRQRTYARKFKSNSVYTPQMVVNGKYEFVGSSRKNWKEAKSKAITETTSHELKLKMVEINKEKVVVSIESDQAVSGLILNVALAESNLNREVARGENSGRTLYHDNVVRAFTSRQFDGQVNTFVFALNSVEKLENCSLIAYTQDQSTWHVASSTSYALADL
ncbi:MAG: DUF1223 domain-containing protein [Bacteroidota bacterium]